MQKYLRGQIWWCACSYDVNSDERNYSIDDKQEQFNHIQYGMRPVLIVSNDIGNRYSEIVQVVPCTSSDKKELPTHCSLYIGKTKNIFLCEQMRTVNKSDLKVYMTTLDNKELTLVERCIKVSLGMEKITHFDKIHISNEEVNSTLVNNTLVNSTLVNNTEVNKVEKDT